MSEQRRAYMKVWRAKHRTSTNEYRKRYQASGRGKLAKARKQITELRRMWKELRCHVEILALTWAPISKDKTESYCHILERMKEMQP